MAEEPRTLVSCWLLTRNCSQLLAMGPSPDGPHNMATCFFKASKEKSLSSRQMLQSCVMNPHARDRIYCILGKSRHVSHPQSGGGDPVWGWASEGTGHLGVYCPQASLNLLECSGEQLEWVGPTLTTIPYDRIEFLPNLTKWGKKESM